jgi:monovalent cation:H+ antiporter-2, CPA2 family
LPLRDAFAVLFFVSVGMLFEPRVLVDHPLRVLAVVGIIIIGKSLAAALVVLVFRYPLNTALTISASLAQVGEFSFILASLGVSLKLLPTDGQSLIVAGALISIALNPFVFSMLEPALKWARDHSAMARRLDERDDPLASLPITTEQKYLSKQIVLIGYGRVGRRIGQALRSAEIPFVVAEQNREVVDELRETGIQAVYGDASEAAVIVQTHVANATMLVIATPDTVAVRKMIDMARRLNPEIQIVTRLHSEAEGLLFERENLAKVFLGENELAQAMIRHVLGSAR